MPWAAGELAAFATEVSRRCAARATQLGVGAVPHPQWRSASILAIDEDLRRRRDEAFAADVARVAALTAGTLSGTAALQGEGGIDHRLVGLARNKRNFACYDGRQQLDEPWDLATETPRIGAITETPPFSAAPSQAEVVAWRHYCYIFERVPTTTYAEVNRTQMERSVARTTQLLLERQAAEAKKPKAAKKPGAGKPAARKKTATKKSRR